MSLIVKCDDSSGCAATREQGDVNNEWIIENHEMRDGSTVRKDLCPAHRPKSEREWGAEDMRAAVLEIIKQADETAIGADILEWIEQKVEALKVAP